MVPCNAANGSANGNVNSSAKNRADNSSEHVPGSSQSPDTGASTGALEATGLLQHPDLWRAGQLAARPNTVSSGFPELDDHLPGRGWPESGLSELLLPTAGIGELRLLVPLLRRLSEQMRWIAWINPPFIPYAPALAAAGVDISKILLIHPKNHKDALWALERASRSGTCSAALAWLDESQLAVTETRRLQLAARQGRTLTCLFRPRQAAQAHSMAELRIQIDAPDEAGVDELDITILKRRGGWPVSGLRVALDRGRSNAEVQQQLSLWRLWRVRPQIAPGERQPEAIPYLPAAGAQQHVTH